MNCGPAQVSYCTYALQLEEPFDSISRTVPSPQAEGLQPPCFQGGIQLDHGRALCRRRGPLLLSFTLDWQIGCSETISNAACRVVLDDRWRVESLSITNSMSSYL